MPKDKEHVQQLVQEFVSSGVDAVEFVNYLENFLYDSARPILVFRLNRSNPRPGSAIRFRDAALELDEAIMRYANWRRNAEC